MTSARFFEETGVLVLTGHAFGGGHLFSNSGEGQWWHLTWAVKGGYHEVEKKWDEMGRGEEPIPCLLYMDQSTMSLVAPDRLPQFNWIDEEIARAGRGVHIPCEVVRVCWLDSTVDEGMYPWRLRIKATGPFRYKKSRVSSMAP